MTNAKTEPVTDDDLYRHSSQFRLWSFTKQEFEEAQKKRHDAAYKVMAKKLADKGITDLEPLTQQEEQNLVRFYASQINAVVTQFHMPSAVRATATSYFEKFYLVNSVMVYHPKNIMYTCVFFASKSENCFISINDFCSRIKGSQQQHILDLEFLILQSLSFTLQVHNPLKAVHGFFLDMQSVLKNDDQVRQLLDKARELIKQGFVSNAGFFYTPPQIALASLVNFDAEMVKQYLQARYSEDQTEQLLAISRDCLEDLKDNQVCSPEEARRVDRKLHSLLDLDKYMEKVAKRKADEMSEPDAKKQRLESPSASASSSVPPEA